MLLTSRRGPTIVVNTIVSTTYLATPELMPPQLSDLEFHILLALGNGASHGYAIGKDVEERSGGRLDPTTGALYQALKRLREDGLIRAVKAERGADSRRRYFELAAAGRRAAAAEAGRLDALVATARKRKLYARGARS
jgi:DNA-binding PadR family transcriptional regulator